MATNLASRVKKLEDIVSKHIEESGWIKANLKWNTTITGGIAIAVLAKILIDFLIKR